MRSVDDIGDELYAVPPPMFTAARDAAVAQARAEGDVAAARQLAALKRPTQGAYLVNLLALRRPDVVTELIDLGEQIRAAQGTVSAAQLRALTAQRRTVLSNALAQCRALAAEAGAAPPSATQLAEAEATLAAAMADPAAAHLVRSGRVVKALSYTGFGDGSGATSALTSRSAARREAPEPSARPPQGRTGPEGRATAPDEQAELERRRRAEEQAALERLAQAEAALAAAWEQERAANDEVDRIADEISRLRAALDEASRRARTARAARQAAERAVAAARRTVAATG
ncbi:MAG: hypothetical protein IRY85_04315 [Micromonosporaceae bacterium]|nr:hypothetical protein [Micromonosporaceae bacterium]